MTESVFTFTWKKKKFQVAESNDSIRKAAVFILPNQVVLIPQWVSAQSMELKGLRETQGQPNLEGLHRVEATLVG